MDAQKAFRILKSKEKIFGYDFIDDIEGGLDNEMFSLHYKDELGSDGYLGGRPVAIQDIETFKGATVYKGGANTFYEALDTVAHEYKHLDPTNIQSYKLGLPSAENSAYTNANLAVNAWKLCRGCKL